MAHRTPKSEELEPPLHVIRGYRVILDSDLARLYGISTMRLNQAAKRNADRFPSDFVFQLVPEEWEALNRSQFAAGSPDDPMRSQFATASSDGPMPSQIVIASPENAEFGEISPDMLSPIAIASRKPAMRSQFVTASGSESQNKRNDRFLPWAFTEHGALMAGTILRSPTAVQMSLYVVRAFVKLRRIALENENLSRRMVEAEVALRQHDVLLTDLYDKLEPLLEPEPAPESVPMRRFGFETVPPEPPTSTA